MAGIEDSPGQQRGWRAQPASGGEAGPYQSKNQSGRKAERQLSILLGLAIVLGGGGVGPGLFNLIVQLFAIALLAMNLDAVAGFIRNGPRGLLVLALASLALPLLQSIPLPPAIWQELPGRDLVRESLKLVDREQSWFPLSVDSNRTLIAAISLLPCAAVFALARRLDDERTGRILQLIVLLGVVNLAFGAVQLASGNAHGNFYPGGKPSILYGTFANRNSTALFLDIALIACLVMPTPKANAVVRGLRILIGAALALGVLLTQSRSGTALLVLVIGVWLVSRFLVHVRRSSGSRQRRLHWQLPAAALAVVVVGGVIATSQKLDQTFDRFATLDDVRPEIWADSLASARRFWPVGSGISTFDEVFQLDESLEYLEAARSGRAHNDYLELVIESGAFGVALAAAWFAWLAICGGRTLRASHLPFQQGALLVLLLILLQSAVDYPLRNQALLCVAAFMVNVLARYPRDMASLRANG